MATFNAPVTTKLWTKDYTSTFKVTGQYNTTTAVSNNKIIVANTLPGANASVGNCIIELTRIAFACGIANGFLSLEYASAQSSGANANQTIVTMGKYQSGDFEVYIPNTLGANATGDINLFVSNVDANDTYTLIVNFKANTLCGAWANVENQPPFGYV